MMILRSTASALIATLLSACGSSDAPVAPSGTGGFVTGTGGAPLATGGAATGGQGGVSTGGQPPSTGGQNTGGAGSDAGGSGTPDAAAKKPPACLKDSSEIALIGDAYVNWISHTFGADINAASSLTIENFAVSGASMGSGGNGLIGTQFDAALTKLPKLTTIIMSGGGTDVFTPDTIQFPQSGQCRNVGARAKDIPDCVKIVDKAVEAATALFEKMAKSGVKDVVYFFYPKLPTNTIIGGNNPNGMLEYAMPKLRAVCEGASKLTAQASDTELRCQFVDLVPVFASHPEYFALGDMNPSPAGSKVMAEAIWTRMKTECVGQPASSGCCTP